MYKMSDMYPYKPLKKYEGLYGKIPVRSPTTYVGVEIELEKVLFKRGMTAVPSSFTVTDDNSLKLDGRELITVPIKVCYLEKELERIFASIEYPLISSRCSIHVHLNARDLTYEELKNMILLYSIYEKAFFNFANKKYDRWNNIFCVPLEMWPDTVSKMLRVCEKESKSFNWYKYYAMNLSPIWGGESKHILGTIEFRHMEATLDIEHIINWINLIVSLKITAKKMKSIDIEKALRAMNTDSSYNEFTKYVFGKWSHLISNQNTFKKDVERGIMLTKRLINQGNTKKEEIIPHFNFKGEPRCVA